MKAAREVSCASALNRCGIPGMDWCVNPYVGCTHACVYCYASFMKRFTGHDEPWGTFVEAKANLPAVLARQAARASGTVMLASVTDAWQPAESVHGLTRAALKAIAGTGLAPRVLTKSDLVVRDLDLLRSFGGLLGDSTASVGFTVTTLDDRLARVLEPGAAPPSRRLAALSRLAAAGIRTWVFVAPILPGLTDDPDAIAAIASAARSRGAAEVEFDPMNFYPGAVAAVRRVAEAAGPGPAAAFRAAALVPSEWRERIRALASEAIGDGGA
ncbi:MAG: radical SAM protein [Deltaproteobacteria bacterium]|nr:radical SAM protein [Deltaproteobacteria bacterium]